MCYRNQQSITPIAVLYGIWKIYIEIGFEKTHLHTSRQNIHWAVVWSFRKPNRLSITNSCGHNNASRNSLGRTFHPKLHRSWIVHKLQPHPVLQQCYLTFTIFLLRINSVPIPGLSVVFGIRTDRKSPCKWEDGSKRNICSQCDIRTELWRSWRSSGRYCEPWSIWRDFSKHSSNFKKQWQSSTQPSPASKWWYCLSKINLKFLSL